ncbi:hypothetical protein K456DRAFT_1612932 [Colletotrichum gloeosporioides 23]|nr:hypothetical protein K456DRAFT_1612932 [Colletotrichum gloeosporioides 23]
MRQDEHLPALVCLYEATRENTRSYRDAASKTYHQPPGRPDVKTAHSRPFVKLPNSLENQVIPGFHRRRGQGSANRPAIPPRGTLPVNPPVRVTQCRLHTSLNIPVEKVFTPSTRKKECSEPHTSYHPPKPQQQSPPRGSYVISCMRTCFGAQRRDEREMRQPRAPPNTAPGKNRASARSHHVFQSGAGKPSTQHRLSTMT